MSVAILFHFLCDQHVSDINIIHHQVLATILLNYHIGRIVLGSMCVGVSVWLVWSGICVAGFGFTECGNSTAQSQVPDDGYINVRNMLST